MKHSDSFSLSFMKFKLFDSSSLDKNTQNKNIKYVYQHALINYSFHKISIWQKNWHNHQNYQKENQYHLCHFRIKVEKFHQWLQKCTYA